jgi:predicted GIY-YIG superfamily endonuclease
MIEPYKIRIDDRYEVTFDELLNVKVEALTERCKQRLPKFGPPMYVREEISKKRQHMGYLYLIHFDIPYKHAKHYLGFSKDIPARLIRHQAGRGSNLMRVIEEAGIPWKVTRIWVGDRYLERKFKKHSSTRYCPVCRRIEQYTPKEQPTIQPDYVIRGVVE